MREPAQLRSLGRESSRDLFLVKDASSQKWKIPALCTVMVKAAAAAVL
jgi:hypothetical protein